MERLYTDQLRPGMMIARTVYGADGRPLLTQNTQLTEAYIRRLDNLGIGSVYIKDGFSDIEIPEIISAQVMTAVSTNLKTALVDFAQRKAIDIAAVKKSVALLIDNILMNRHLLIHIEDIRSYDDYLLFHSINVAVLSVMTGLSLGYPEGNLMDLGMGALLHDIGMISVAPEILSKTEELNGFERAQVRKHPEVGFNILRNYREISTPAAHIAYQHHERFDGAGYPRQLSKKQIIEYAKIAAVADTFDAVVSDRPYRKGYSTTDGLIVVKKLVSSYFDPDIVEAFAANIAMYPVGCLLELSNDKIAVVISATKANASRPVVYVICDKERNLVQPFYGIDLMQNRDVRIIKRLDKEETESIRSVMRTQINVK
ncbi:HD-GYP domain-containing protein [Syntrophomonas palmitatica]|uniref:HD-GYP domain-containing protein n=1 Tax=Syntrophomonas palmitatica TaxID=402877 RepID=UPI0006D0BDFB|nr:HD-GYP domain-containing protein [Syntrophomonas palmitatica]